MTASRAALRAAARASLAASPQFAQHAVGADWGRDRDSGSLPSADVYTPRFTPRDVARGARDTEVDLLVLIRRQGGADLEDMLDGDATAAEAAVLAALLPMTADVMLVSGENDVPGVGEQRIGTLMLTFRCRQLTDRPV